MSKEHLSHLEMVLFSTNLAFAWQAQEAGVDAVMVDWERHGKASRQRGYDTQVNADTPDDARRMAHVLRIPVYVRIDIHRGDVASEVELALDCGARGIMLPMARSASEVASFVEAVRGRATTIVQIETQSLVNELPLLADVGWDRAYIGLNDLMIARGSRWIWEPVVDGTVDQIMATLAGRRVGWGGLTIVGGGTPLPMTTLLRELARTGCAMSFLRRSFHREINGRSMVDEIRAIRAAWSAATARSQPAIHADHLEFLKDVELTRKLERSAV